MNESVKKFLTKKNIISAIVLVIILVAIPITVRLVQQQQNLKSKAAETPVSWSGNLLPAAMQNAGYKTTPNQKVSDWFRAGTYTLSGTITKSDPVVQSNPTLVAIQADEWTENNSAFIGTHPSDSTFTVPAGNHVAVMLRVINADAVFSNVSFANTTGSNLLLADMQNATLKATPNQKVSAWIGPGDYKLNGDISSTAVIGSNPTGAVIQADEWTNTTPTAFVYTHSNKTSFRVQPGNHVAVILRVINADATFSNVSLTNSLTGAEALTPSTDWQNVKVKDTPIQKESPSWLEEPGTYKLNGNVLSTAVVPGNPTLAAIQADVWKKDNSAFVGSYPSDGNTFTVASGNHAKVILRAINADAVFSNVSLTNTTGSNLLLPDMQNFSSKDTPLGAVSAWFGPSTYTLSGTITKSDPVVQSNPTLVAIQADEWTENNTTFVGTHPSGSTFTVPDGNHVAVILRAINADAVFSNVSLQKDLGEFLEVVMEPNCADTLGLGCAIYQKMTKITCKVKSGVDATGLIGINFAIWPGTSDAANKNDAYRTYLFTGGTTNVQQAIITDLTTIPPGYEWVNAGGHKFVPVPFYYECNAGFSDHIASPISGGVAIKELPSKITSSLNPSCGFVSAVGSDVLTSSGCSAGEAVAVTCQAPAGTRIVYHTIWPGMSSEAEAKSAANIGKANEVDALGTTSTRSKLKDGTTNITVPFYYECTAEGADGKIGNRFKGTVAAKGTVPACGNVSNMVPAEGSTIAAGSQTLTWNPAPGATKYGIRIDDRTDGKPYIFQLVTCPAVNNLVDGDFCQNDVTSGSVTYDFKPGHTYDWWIFAYGECSVNTDTAVHDVTVPSAVTPTITSEVTPTGVTVTPTPSVVTPTITSEVTPTGVIVTPTATPTIYTTHYRCADQAFEKTIGADVLPWQAYTADLVIPFTFTHNLIPGNNLTLFCQFKDNSGNTTPASVVQKSIKYLGGYPAIRHISCEYDPVSVDTTSFTIKGVNFGPQQQSTGSGKVEVSGKGTNITFWEEDVAEASQSASLDVNYKVIAKIGEKLPVNSDIPVVLTTNSGETATGTCRIGATTVDLTANTSCGPLSGDLSQNDVTVEIIEKAAKPKSIYKQKIKIDKQGKPTDFKPQLEIGKTYALTIKSPGSLTKKTEFVAEEGTTVLGEIKMMMGDIYPVTDPDNIINAYDKNRMLLDWSLVTDVTKAADLNRDQRVNSVDYSCLLINYNQTGN